MAKFDSTPIVYYLQFIVAALFPQHNTQFNCPSSSSACLVVVSNMNHEEIVERWCLLSSFVAGNNHMTMCSERLLTLSTSAGINWNNKLLRLLSTIVVVDSKFTKISFYFQTRIKFNNKYFANFLSLMSKSSHPTYDYCTLLNVFIKLSIMFCSH